MNLRALFKRKPKCDEHHWHVEHELEPRTCGTLRTVRSWQTCCECGKTERWPW